MPITNAQPSTPARKTSKSAPKASHETGSLTSRDQVREANLLGVMQAGSMVALIRGWYADAGAVSLHGPKVAKELVLLGKTNDGVGKALDLLSQAGPYTGLIFASLPLLAQLAVNHNRLDSSKISGIPGIKSKEALESQVKAEIAEEELKQLQAAKETEANVAKLKREMESSDAVA
jgi:hypothetical protein